MKATTTSFRLAKLWTALEETQQRINNEIIPLGFNLRLDDPELMSALETVTERIAAHFERFELQVVKAKKQ